MSTNLKERIKDDLARMNREDQLRKEEMQRLLREQNEQKRRKAEMGKLLQEKEIFSNEIVTEIKPLEKFYYAEEYHQNYEKNNPNNPYVRQVSIPRLRKFQNAFPELLKKNH